jgi:hypothetical protein
MKKMSLTGLGSEQKFGHTTNGTEFYLVFNDGELRVPISEEAAHVVVRCMYGSPDLVDSPTVVEESPTPSEESGGGSDEDGIDQI